MSGQQTRSGENVVVVRDQLRDAIIAGRLEPGEIRSQTVLSEQLGVGRGVVREALRLLDMEGLVVGEPNKRVRIAELTAADAEDLYIVRLSLEIPAAWTTVPTLEFSDFGELEGHFAQMDHYQRGSDWAGLADPHRAFHLKLVSAGGARTVELIRQHFDYAERYRRAYRVPSPEGWAIRQEEHRALINAADAGDAQLTAQLLAEHYAGTAGLLFRQLDPSHQPTRLRRMLETLLPEHQGAVAALDAHAMEAS